MLTMKKYLVEINVINEIDGKDIYTKIVEMTVDGKSKEDVLNKILPYTKDKTTKKHRHGSFSCFYDFRYYVYRREHDDPIATIDVIEITE